MTTEITLSLQYPGVYVATAEIAGETVNASGDRPSDALATLARALDADHDREAERQFDARHEGEPPITMREQHLAAWEEKRALEDGRL